MDNSDATEPTIVQHESRFSTIWLLPLVTLLIGGWLIAKTIYEQGPEITISFQNAEGIEAGKTSIRYKNLEIGKITAVTFGRDFGEIVATAKIDKSAASLIRRGSKFWVVKPRLSLQGVSGLDTLVAGSYIKIQPGEGDTSDSFSGLAEPPAIPEGEKGIQVTLMSESIGSIDVGSPVFYQGLAAGEVTRYKLAQDNRTIIIDLFIREPFSNMVNETSYFWNVSGVDMQLNANGISVHTESLRSILLGGIAFNSESLATDANTALQNLVFSLYQNRQEIVEAKYKQKIQFVLFFDSSVRGLSIGAPVEFKGIKVGSVSDVKLVYDGVTKQFKIPVMIELEPERITGKSDTITTSPQQFLQTLIQQGLRAQLQTGSMLTGQLYVQLDLRPDTPLMLSGESLAIPELPTIPAGLEAMTLSVQKILTNMEQIDFDKISTQLSQTLESTNMLLNNPKLAQTIEATYQSAQQISKLIQMLQNESQPILTSLEQITAATNAFIIQSQQTVSSVDKLMQSDSPIQYSIIEMSNELAETARSVRYLVNMLERNPDSMLFGRE